jgi:hypothetical protein
MKKNKFIYKKQKHFRNECIGWYNYLNDNDEYNKGNYNKFIKTVDNIYDFTINNVDTIYVKGLKYPTTYVLEKLKSLRRKRYRYNMLVSFINDSDNIIEIYLSLFNKPRSELINYYYNDILLYQYDKRLNIQQINKDINNYSYCNHHYLIDLDNIADKYGIYKLYDKDKKLVYIGKSYTLGLRIQSSLKERNCIYYSYCILETKKQTDLYEKYYISKLKPKYNIIDINTDISKLNLQEIMFSDIKSNYPMCIDMQELTEREIVINAYNVSK